jgi:hypothetical protein
MEEVIVDSLILFQIIVAVWALLKWKTVQGAQRFLILLFVEIALSSVVCTVLGWSGRNNLWVIHIATLCDFIIEIGMFILWKKRKYEKRVLFIVGCLFVIVWLISKWTFEPMDKFDSYTSVISSVAELIIAITILFDVLRDAIPSLRMDPRVWVASGIIIYTAGALFILALFNEMLNISPDLIKKVWPLNWLLSFIGIILMARSLTCQKAHGNAVDG